MALLYLSYNIPMPPASPDLISRVRPGPAGGPLLVTLHGLGGDERVMSIFDRAVPADFTIVSPRAPIEIQPDRGFPPYVDRGYSWLPPGSSLEIDRAEFEPAADRVTRLIHAAIETFHVDRPRVYLMGFSQGAALSYVLSLMRPDLIAGVIALAGFLPGGDPPAGEAYPPHGYLIIHGTADQRVPVLYAHRARDALRAWGAPVEYHAYPVGHKVAPPGLRDIQRWLTAAGER